MSRSVNFYSEKMTYLIKELKLIWIRLKKNEKFNKNNVKQSILIINKNV